MRRAIVVVGVFICQLFLFSSAEAYHTYSFVPQDRPYCDYYYDTWLPPICRQYPTSQPVYIFQPPPIYLDYPRVPPAIVYYHIEILPPEVKYRFHERADRSRSPLPEPALPPRPDKEKEKKICLNSELLWLEAGESVSENVFVSDDPEKRHAEHLKRLGRYNWTGKYFEQLPKGVERYFGKEIATFTAPETGCYVRNQSGQWKKINIH